MRSLTVIRVAVLLWLSYCTAMVQAEPDDIHQRIQTIGKKAKNARIEAAQKIKEQEDQQAAEIKTRLAEIEKWTTAQFELGERGIIDKPKVMTELMKTWQTANEREIYKFLQFPEKSMGAIESGRALNGLLVRVGPAAQQNQQTRRFNPASALPLHASSANEQVSEETFNHLTVQSKTLGARDVRRGNADPIDVDWPAILRAERWAVHRTAIEKARKRALDEMATTNGISPDAEKELREAVGALNKDFTEYRKHFHEQTFAPGTAGLEYNRVFEGRTHILKLSASVFYVVQAKSLADMPQREQYHGGNIEEFLSHMMRNNLEFGAPSKVVDRSAYHTVFNLMVRYYLDQNAMTKLQRQLEQELDEHKNLSREAADVALGKVMSANMKAAQNIEEMKFIRELIKD